MTELRDTQKRVAWRCALSAMDKRLEIGDTAYDALRAAVKAFADVYDEECALIQNEQAEEPKHISFGWVPPDHVRDPQKEQAGWRDDLNTLLSAVEQALKDYNENGHYLSAETGYVLQGAFDLFPTPPQGEDG